MSGNHQNIWNKIWEELYNSNTFFKGNFNNWKDRCPRVPGFYIFRCPDIPIPEEFLKIGIGQGKDGLFGRLKTHYKGEVKEKFGSILNTRLGKDYSRRDVSLGDYMYDKYNINLMDESNRKVFIEDYCEVQILPTQDLFDTYGTLKFVESNIENYLKNDNRVRLINGHNPLWFS